jgi:hypothetical protein
VKPLGASVMWAGPATLMVMLVPVAGLVRVFMASGKARKSRVVPEASTHSMLSM